MYMFSNMEFAKSEDDQLLFSGDSADHRNLQVNQQRVCLDSGLHQKIVNQNWAKIGPSKPCLKTRVLLLFSTSEVLQVCKKSEKSNEPMRTSFTKAGNGRTFKQPESNL